MFTIFLKKSHDRVIALVAGPSLDQAAIEEWRGEAQCDTVERKTAATAIECARDRDAAIIFVRGTPDWPDFAIPDLDRIISG